MRFLTIVDRAKINSVLLGIASGMAGGEKNKMFAVGQKPRPTLRGVQRPVDYCRRLGGATSGAHLRQGTRKIRGEHDYVVDAPGSTARIRRIGDGGSRTACGRDPHNLAAGKETDIAPVGGPEGMRRARSAVERLRRVTRQRTDPQ